MEKSIARLISLKLQKDAKKNIGTFKTFLGAKPAPAELKPKN